VTLRRLRRDVGRFKKAVLIDLNFEDAMSQQTTTRFHKRRIFVIAGAALLLAVIIIIVARTGRTSSDDHVYSVDEAIAKRTKLNGKHITIQGYSIPIYETTLKLCQPERCDCNRIWSDMLYLVSADTYATRRSGQIDKEQAIA
jgi:hypothetical protein